MRWTPDKLEAEAKKIIDAEGEDIKLVVKLARPSFYKGRTRESITFASVGIRSGNVFVAIKPGTHYLTPLRTLPHPVLLNVESISFERTKLNEDWIPFRQMLSRKHGKYVWRNVTEESHIAEAVTDGHVKIRRMASTPFKNHSDNILKAFDEKRSAKWTHKGKLRNMELELTYNEADDDLQGWFTTTSKYGHGEKYMLISPTTAVLVDKN